MNSKAEASMSLEGDTILAKLGKITKSSSTRVPSMKDFSIVKIISRGAFGQVFLGYKNTDESKLFAIKVMKKSEMINKNMVTQVITERNVLALTTSPYCVHLYYSLQSAQHVFLVMEYMIGGDLKSLITAYGYFCESAARFYCAEITMALEYLHKHGIIHRDIKPDNMLLSASGHVKLTDFGLSKIEISRDLEMSDFLASSPCLQARTPGQLLSLTSHLTFGSNEPKYRNKSIQCTSTNIFNPINRQRSLDCDLDSSLQKNNDVSGVLPFFSSEDVYMSIQHSDESKESYYTCNSSVGNRNLSECTCSTSFRNAIEPRQCDRDNCKNTERLYKQEIRKYPLLITYCTIVSCCAGHLSMEMVLQKVLTKLEAHCIDSLKMKYLQHLKENEDSGISSIRSSNIQCELSAIEKCDKEDLNCFNNNNSNINNDSNGPRANGSPSTKFLAAPHFKRPDSVQDNKRSHHMLIRAEEGGSGSTGLTQEIDLMDIGSSTPKRRKSKSPLKGVLKIRSLSDDEAPTSEPNTAQVLFSTPVSSLKAPRSTMSKLKMTRFQLPPSSEKLSYKSHISISSSARYINNSPMSPVNSGRVVVGTPKVEETGPFRTPRSVRRNQAGSNERILGTPDYLGPELLLQQKHGAAVDWWSLGVCLFEFMTGIPCFNDETPQKVFDNILSRNIQWDLAEEPLSVEAIDAVEQLLTMDPSQRPSSKEVQTMLFFAPLDWNTLQSTVPPFVPQPQDQYDTGYFEPRNIMQHLKLSNIDISEFIKETT